MLRSATRGRMTVQPAEPFGVPASATIPAVLAGARKRPLWVVFLLTFGTSSFYFFVHLGLMWREMKRARQDPTMRPLGHALAQIVPFYGWFRFHAHVRTLDEMLTTAGSSIRVSAGRATTMYVIIALFGLLAGSRVAPTWLVFPSFAAYGAFAAWRQRLLNLYYDQVAPGAIPERVHPVEWVFVVVGCILVTLSLLGVLLS